MGDTTRGDHKSTSVIDATASSGKPRSVLEGCKGSRYSNRLSQHSISAISSESAPRIDHLPTCGPSGVLILTIHPASTVHALPERIGRTNDSTNLRGADWILEYRPRSTVRGEPAVGRYAGRGAGIGLRDLSLSSEEGSCEVIAVVEVSRC